MNIQELFIAKVTDNNDPDQEGKVQIDIPELFRGEIGATDLPWARQSRSNSSDIPENFDWVFVWMHDEENFKNFYYGEKVTLKQYHDHLKLKDSATATALIQSAYPDVKFNFVRNGIVIGHSSSMATPEIFMIHPKGASIYIDPLGAVTVKGAANIAVAGALPKGGFCTIPVCPLTGLIQISDKLS